MFYGNERKRKRPLYSRDSSHDSGRSLNTERETKTSVLKKVSNQGSQLIDAKINKIA